MKKLEKCKLKELIYNEEESSYIDFKAKQYSKDKNEELIKDIMSMANSDINIDKFIVIGVKFKAGQKNEFIGINDDIHDDADYQQLISNNIEPTIKFSYLSDEIDGKKVAYFYIYSNNIDKPYMMKKDNNKLKIGDAFKRVGSSQRKLTRRDYDNIYKRNNKTLLNLEKIDSYKNEIKLIEILKESNNYIIYENNII